MDATFWSLVGLILFLALIGYMGVHKTMARGLDSRADKIRSELDEARRLREEAQELLAEYQRKRKQAEQEASEIVAAARREAETLEKDAERKTAEFVARRTAMAEQKIAQAQGQAIAEVRASAVDLAIKAAASIIDGKVSGATADNLIKSSIAEVKAKLN